MYLLHDVNFHYNINQKRNDTEELDRNSYSMIARDYTGALLEAVAVYKSGDIDPVLAEAIGIRSRSLKLG